MAYFDQYVEFDPFITPTDPANPWISDNTEFWEQELTMYVCIYPSFIYNFQLIHVVILNTRKNTSKQQIVVFILYSNQ